MVGWKGFGPGTERSKGPNHYVHLQRTYDFGLGVCSDYRSEPTLFLVPRVTETETSP